MLIQLVSTKKNRVDYAKTLLLNTNRITDTYEVGSYASGSVEITSFANLVSGTDDEIEVAGVTFTAQAGAASGGDPTFQAATSNSATATSLAAQINAYDQAGALNVNRVTATANGAEVSIVADDYGTAANSYTLAYTDKDANVGATVSGSTLSGGEASTCKLWYSERIGDRRDKTDEYELSTTYPSLKSKINGSEIKNARVELTVTERNSEAFVKTLNVSLDDIVKVLYLDADESYVYLARGAFKVDKLRVTHTRAQILALQNAIYNRGTAGTSCVATEYGDDVYHKTELSLSDWTVTVTNASLGIGAKIYDMPEGYVTPTHGILDLSISSDTNTDTPDLGLGHVIASGAVTVLGGTATFESILDGFAATAITPAGSATTKQFNAEADLSPHDGHATALDVFLNVADAWGAAGDIVINGTITLFWKYIGDL